MKKKITSKRILLGLLAIFLAGAGIAFNSLSTLGNDSVALLYDGFRAGFHLDMDKLGIVSNTINLVLVIIVLLMYKKFINIGTLIYTVLLGTVISFVSNIYSMFNIPLTIMTKIILAICGCSLLYIGIGLYIAVNIGLDPVSAFEMSIAEKFRIKFSTSKIIFDFSSIIIGVLLGGKMGLLTIITALTAGFSIQFFANLFQTRLFNIDC